MPKLVEYETRAEEHELYPALANEQDLNEFFASQTNWLDRVPEDIDLKPITYDELMRRLEQDD